jgi:beta-glucosidase/6-phospho-beta-glucosidase/beta-galactosidase
VATEPEAHTLELDGGFVVATGIECSAPVIAGGVRMDELVKTGHWERYAEDFALIESFGIRFVRYGLPFHVVARSDDPADFDWTWTDAALASLREHGIEPIVDLLHFGLPDDIAAVGDPRLAPRHERFVAAVVARYPWLRYYTPVNEPLITAMFSAREGLWNERARDDTSFVAALGQVVTCAIRGMEIIREARPDAIFIQSDSCSSYLPVRPEAEERATFLRELGFVAWDVTYGRDLTSAIRDFLVTNGMPEAQLAWFAEHASAAGCIVGHDYYRGTEFLVDVRGRPRRAGARRVGYLQLAREHGARYGLPYMLSETNIAGNLAPGWLTEMWNAAVELRAQGEPIRGVCWYGFVDHVDWDSALTRNDGRVNHCGLVGLDRSPHRVGRMYAELAHAAAAGRFDPLPVARAARRGRSS